jgi:hypothetical protein
MRAIHLDALGEEQLDCLESQLSWARRVALFLHHPLRTDRLRPWCKPI